MFLGEGSTGVLAAIMIVLCSLLLICSVSALVYVAVSAWKDKSRRPGRQVGRRRTRPRSEAAA